MKLLERFPLSELCGTSARCSRPIGLIFAVLVASVAAPVVSRSQAPASEPASATASVYATGLEVSEGKTTTSRDDELRLLAAFAADSPRVEMEIIGESVSGRPIHLVRVGFPEAPTDEQLADGRNLLFIGAQHGDEPSGREGTLRLIRELAFTDDSELIEQLSQINVLVIPTANPDGLVKKARRNAAGLDINRDHLLLKTPEARVIAAVIRDYRPEILVDAHESGNAPNRPDETARLEALWPANLNTHPEIRELSRRMIEDHLFPAVKDAGYGARLWKGRGSNEGVLRNMIGLRHGVGMVSESFRATAADRADLQYLMMSEVLRFQRQFGDEVAEAIRTARQTAEENAEQSSRKVYFAGTEDNEPPESKVVASPAGYLLNHLQLEALAPQFEHFAIRYEPVRDGVYFVPLAQPMGSVIPLMIDDRADKPVVAAVPVPDIQQIASLEPAPLPPPPSAPAQHFVDFASLSVTEGLPDGWKPLWKPGDWTLSPDPGVLVHRIGEGSGRRAIAWETPEEIIGDVEVYTKVRAESSNTLFQLAIHLSGDAGDENAYYVDVRLSDKRFRINRYRNGRFSVLKTAEFSPEPDAWYHVRFRRQGERLMARIWAEGTAEPKKWMVEASDATHSSGKVGFAGIQSNSINEWAVLGVGVGGEPAPTASQ